MTVDELVQMIHTKGPQCSVLPHASGRPLGNCLTHDQKQDWIAGR